MAEKQYKLPGAVKDKHTIYSYFSHQVCTEHRPDRVALVIQLSPAMVSAAAGLLMQAAQQLDEEFEEFDAEMAQLYASTAYELRAAYVGVTGMSFNPEILDTTTAPTLALDTASPKDLILSLPAWERAATPPLDQFVITWTASNDNTWSTVETSVVLDVSGKFHIHYVTNFHPLV